LQALLFNWYRHKIALKYGVPHFKPVILFRSKTIDVADTNNSKEDYLFFRSLIENLNVADFDFLQEIDEQKLMDMVETYQKGQSRIIDVKWFIGENNISIREIIDYLQYHFAEYNCVITNSKTNKTKKEKTDTETDRLLNSLEDKENHIRAIFTVQRLTEGWDVQNLFDIVRLYEGQNTGGSNKGNRGGATTSEVQLIGRGVRYYPFDFQEKEKNRRKFDNDLNHELRVLEEFYFHSDNDERYLSELKKELKDKEWLVDNKIARKFEVKKKFLEEDTYKNIFINKRLDNPKRQKNSLEQISKDFNFEFVVDNLNINETIVKLDLNEADRTRYSTGANDMATLDLKLKDFGRHLAIKAINKLAVKENSIFRYKNLKNELNINCVEDIFKEEFLGNFRLKIKIPKKNYSGNITLKENLEQIEADQILIALMRFFEKIAVSLKQISNPYIGSEFQSVSFKEVFAEPKVKSILEDDANKAIESLIKDKDWYVLSGFHGTSEEQALVRFLSEVMGNFENQYEHISLLRNEEVYKIYDFEQGRGFMPDFMLFLKQKNKGQYYQIFIEPKGDQFKDDQGTFFGSKEGWKERFLSQITQKYGNEPILKAENKEFKLYGLPLYNKKSEDVFKTFLDDNILIGS
jgi:type III restriction enzyme